MKKDEIGGTVWKGWMEGNAGRVGWGEPREGVEGMERTRSGRRGPQAPQRLVIQNPHFSTTSLPYPSSCASKAHGIHGWQGASFTPIVSLSFDHQTSDSVIWLHSTSTVRENTLGMTRGLPSLFHFHQSPEKICGSMAI
ncbi:hypothetical protein TNCV_3799841 [Trichonephila clavipes]|nr:hypothetical protein TNCV_3799841 [Trichonephila clavipes]